MNKGLGGAIDGLAQEYVISDEVSERVREYSLTNSKTLSIFQDHTPTNKLQPSLSHIQPHGHVFMAIIQNYNRAKRSFV